MYNLSISVVVLTYNPNWIKLRNTLKSIICQKKVDFEIIVTDDGSKQNYFDNIKQLFEDNNFLSYKLINNKVNQGTVKNVLSALSEATGKYIKLISPGDFLYDEYTLENFVSFIYQNPASFYFGNLFYYSINQDNSICLLFDKKNPNDIRPWIKQNSKKIFRNYLLKGDYICGASTIYDKEKLHHYLIELGGIIKYAEDLVLIYMISKKELGYYIHSNKGIWYEYGTGISTSDNNKFLSIIEQEKHNIYEFLKNKKIIHSWIYKIHYLNNKHIKRLLRLIFFPESFFYRFSKENKGYESINCDINELYHILQN